MKVTMLYDRILVRLIDSSSRTKGGLIIPDIAQENTPHRRAEVLAVGHGRITSNGDTVPLRVSEGDVVLFFRNASGGEQLPVPGDSDEELLVIPERHVVWIYDRTSLPRATGLIADDGRELVVQQ